MFKHIVFILLNLFSITAFAGSSPILWGPTGATSLQSSLVLPGSTSGTLTMSPAASTTSYSFIWPSAQALGFLKNDGSGNLSWSTSTATYTAPIYKTFYGEGVTITGTLTLASVCVSSPSSLVGIYVGVGVTDTTTPTNLPGGTTVAGLPGSCSAGQIQLNNTPNAGGTGNTLVFGATESTTATISTSSACLTTVGSTAGIAPGALIIDITHPTAITTGTTVVAVPGTCSSGQIQMSANGGVAETGDTLNISGGPYIPSSGILYFRVRAVGGGGGGGGATTTTGTGGTGGNTILTGLFTLTGGGGGIPNGNGGTGGIATPASGIQGFCINGGIGGSANQAVTFQRGGDGASSPFGGMGGGIFTLANGSSAAPHSGSGGGGGGAGSNNPVSNGAGGGSGGYCEVFVSSPASQYSLIAGLAGIAGPGNNTLGGVGGSGALVIEEHYQ